MQSVKGVLLLDTVRVRGGDPFIAMKAAQLSFEGTPLFLLLGIRAGSQPARSVGDPWIRIKPANFLFWKL